jgi:hypothetical protein
VIVVSDWRTGDAGVDGNDYEWERALRLLVQRHHVVAVEVRDRREMELTDVGDTYFVDFETGRQIRVDTGDSGLRRRYAEAAALERAHLAKAIKATGAEHCVLETSGDWLRQFASFLSEGRLLRR